MENSCPIFSRSFFRREWTRNYAMKRILPTASILSTAEMKKFKTSQKHVWSDREWGYQWPWWKFFSTSPTQTKACDGRHGAPPRSRIKYFRFTRTPWAPPILKIISKSFTMWIWVRLLSQITDRIIEHIYQWKSPRLENVYMVVLPFRWTAECSCLRSVRTVK